MANSYNFIFPAHPKLKYLLNDVIIHKNILITEPLSYINFMSHMFSASLVITDSGGIQEETRFMGIPCITLRNNTERPITLIENCGTNILANIDDLNNYISKYYNKKFNTNIPLWDGYASQRILDIIQKIDI